MLKLWKRHGVVDPIVVYPPVNLERFWCNTPLSQRKKRVVYVARFIHAKRHEILKQLAMNLPEYEFVSVGGLIEAEKEWFDKFQTGFPKNYTLKTNLPGPELLKILHDSRIYVHLMEGEHFGIAPVEGLASGCVTLVHDSGGMKEFIPETLRWQNYEDLKQKVISNMDNSSWDATTRADLWRKIEVLSPQQFEKSIWATLRGVLSVE